MEEIVIPNLDDDDDDNDYQLPSFSRNAFGNTSSSSLNEYEGASHRHNPSADTLPRFGGPSTTPNRPTLPRAPASHAGVPFQGGYGNSQEVLASTTRPRVGQFSNGSSSSIVTPGTSIGSTTGFLASRKGSLASIKNAFKSAGQPAAVPPVPSIDAGAYSTPGYPTLRNPFSRFEAPASPAGMLGQSPRAGRQGYSASPGPSRAYERNHSIATNHSSHRSQGGRSMTSQGSSNFRAEDHPMPTLPPIPTRSTPSRLGRLGSGSGSSLHLGGGYRRQGSLGGDEILEGKTPGEEALRVISKDFRAVADEKIGRICGRPLNTQPSLPAYLESSSDTKLDTLIASLAHCSRRHPRRVIDLLQNWCRSHCEGIGASEVRAHLDRSHGLQMRVEDAAVILGGRKSAAAKYMLNRALIELVRVTPKEILGEELGMTLEGNAFAAYRNDKGDDLSPHKKAVALLQVELLGELSKTRFLTISDRFIREMSKYAALPSSKDTDARMEHLLRGMRYLKIRVYPEEELEMSSEFIQALASLYASPHVTSQGLKNAYADTLVHLLHPVIETATAEVNHPMWSKAIALILQKALAAASKPKYWAASFPLVVVALGVSPRDVFMQQWQACMDAILPKLRDRSQRVIALNSFNRLLWIYLNRCAESVTSTRKRLDQLTKVFYSTSGALFPGDITPDIFTWMLHYIITRQIDYGEEFLKDFLRGMDGSVSDPLMATRAACLIRAISATLLSTEEERHAAWPASADFHKLPEEGPVTSGETLPEEVARKDEIPELMARCGPAVALLLFNCDRAAGTILLSSDSVTVTGTASSSAIDDSEVVTRKHGDVHASYSTRHEPVMRLLTAVLESLPRTLAPDVNFAPIANALCRGTFSADPRVCETAAAAMRRVVIDPARCLSLVSTYREFIFETRHVFRDTFIGSRLLESQFERMVSTWLDILTQLVQHQRYAAAQPDDTGSARPPTIAPVTMNKIEGAALFLLCSTSLPLRKLAGQILATARDLEGTQRRPSAAFRYSRIVPEKATLTRVVEIYDVTPDEAELAAMRRLPWLSSADRNRFDIVVKDKGKILQRLAESEQGKDTTLWLSILPYFISRVSDALPGPVHELRSVLTPIAMRLQVHVASVANVGSARAAAANTTKGGMGAGMTHRSSSDVAILADHWRTYLSVLCVTMPSSANQPATPSIPRTKDVIILTPDTIATPVLFHYLTSLLAWDDTRYRDAAVYAMGCTGQSHLRPLSDILVGVVRRLADTKKTSSQNSLWTAVAHVFRLISPLILDVKSSSHLANLSSMVSFVRVTYNMLADKANREDYELQSLRRSFCIVVENLTAALGKLDASDRFFGEELRGAIFKLCYDWCHVGRRPDVAKARESHTLQTASDSYKGERDRAQYLDDLQAKTKLLSAAAAEAMAGLCQGALVTSTESTPAVQASSHIVDPLIVLRWIRGMFTSPSTFHHETARKALHSLIKYNWECSRLLDEVLHQSFGEGEQFNLESSFFGVVAEILVEQTLDIPVEQLCCLALSKLGHPVPDVRLRAFQLVGFLLPDAEMRVGIASMLPSIGSSAPSIYRSAQRDISERLASIYADHALAFLAESVSRLSQLEAPRRTATLSVLPAWMQYIELSLDPGALPPDQADLEQHALANIMYLAIRFLNDHLDEVCAVLAAFASAEDTANTTALVKYLFEQGARRRSPEFVLYGQRVLACLSLGAAGEEIFNDICDFVQPDYMALASDPDVAPSPQTSLADLDAIVSVPAGKGQIFSTGQLALLFAGELLPHRLEDPGLSTHLPTLLHVAIAHCDSPVPMIRDQSQAILFQILRVWICDLSGVPSNNAATWAMAEHKLTTLAAGRGTAFWKTDDVGGPDTAFFAPPLMTTMIMKILGVLLPLQPRIRQVWGELALTWATSCPIRHLACRSFQIFRTLSPRVNARMISDILARLSNTIGSASPEIQAFNLEILRTFAAITQSLTAADTALYPQLFWCAMACLTTPYEEEWTEVTEFLSHVMDKTNLSDPAVIQNLVKFQPADWVGPPPHLQALLLVGLRSTKTVFMAFDLIRRLTSVSGAELIDAPADRLIHGFVSALPWMLHSTDLGEPNEDLGMMASDLAAIADSQSLPSFSRLLTSFARAKFRSKDDFIRQACSLLRDYMSSHALQIITLLLGFILNNTDWMRDKSLQILQLILLSPEARAPLVAHGTELLQPLLRLVSTPHAAQALEILDMPVVAAAQAEALTTSMMATGDIFGSISPSGWSVANAKDMSALTRENVKAVFGTCGETTRAASAHFSVVQFKDMKKFATAFNNGGYDEPPPMPGYESALGTGDSMGMGNGGRVLMSSGSGSGGGPDEDGPGMSGDNASMGDLVNALHSLGQFFGEDLAEGDGETGESPRVARGGMAGYARHAAMSSDSISERRVRAIMARGRKPSISSPVYENSAYPYKSRHHATPSDAFTESSVASSDGADHRGTLIPSANGQMARRGPTYGNGNGNGFGKSHSTNLSFSSVSASSDQADHRSENVFGLESGGMMNESMSSLNGAWAGFGQGEDGSVTRGESTGENGDADESYGLSEQSTPVLMRSTKRFAGGNREDAGTPSPGDRRNGNGGM